MLHVIVGLIVWFAWWVLIVFVVWLIWIDCWVCFWFVVCLDGWCCYFDYLLLLCVFDCFLDWFCGSSFDLVEYLQFVGYLWCVLRFDLVTLVARGLRGGLFLLVFVGFDLCLHWGVCLFGCALL